MAGPWRWLMTSERISSAVTTPPALRMTCASPGVQLTSAGVID